jgi:hypothetical protein
MKHDEAYMEAQRIFSRCCQKLGLNQFDAAQCTMAKDMAIIIADEVVRSYPCGCEFSQTEIKRKKAYWLDVKYELTKL